MSATVAQASRTDADKLMDEFGRDAVGEAFLRALNCKGRDDSAGAGWWVDVAARIMETQQGYSWRAPLTPV